jgi:hypothetical protein
MLLWIEGYEGFGTTIGAAPSPANVVARKYSSVVSESGMHIHAGRLSGYSIELNSTGALIRSLALTTNSTMIAGVAVNFGFALALCRFLSFYDGVTLGMNVQLTAAGELAVYRGATLLGTTSGLGLVLGLWYYVEFKVVCDDTTGSYELRVGEVNVLSASGIDTKIGSNAYHTAFQVERSAAVTVLLDDVYCLDGSGSVNNDFLGNSRVSAIYPNGDTASKDWNRSAGADNYALVDEAIVNDDTDYVESGDTGDKDLYDYGAVSGVTVAVRGLQINTMCRETDVTPFNLITIAKAGTTESDDAGQAIGTTSYVSKRRVVELDPDTGVAWTVSGINAAQFGIKVG